MAGIENVVGGKDGKGEIPEAARAIRSAVENLDKKVDGLVSDGRRTFNVIEKTVRNFDENPTRLIFGGGRPANTPGAGIGPIRQPNNAHNRTPARAGAAVTQANRGAHCFMAQAGYLRLALRNTQAHSQKIQTRPARPE